MRAFANTPRHVALWTLLLLAAACSGDGGPGPGPSFSIQISANPSALSLQQGTSGTVDLTLTRGGGFTGTVNVTVAGLPPGVTTSVAPASLTGTTTSAVVTVTVAASVAPGTYTATVTGTAPDVGSASATYQLTVTAIPNYALSVNPTTVPIQAGTTGNATVAIARTNFTGAVALTLDAPPAGITGVFTPASATGDQAALVVSVAGTVLPATYPLTIKGAATGPGDKTTTLTVTVTAAANYTLAVSPTSVPIVQGQSSPLTVTINRTNFTGGVTLALLSPPTGVTATFNPNPSTTNTSTMTLSVAASVAPATHTITVQGTATGVPTVVEGEGAAALVAPGDRTATFELVVTPAAGITLSPAQALISIVQGGSGSNGITIARTAFTSAVALVGSAQQTGLGVTMNPASTATNASTAQVTVAASVQVGIYPVTVTGSGTGIANAQTTFNVQVTAAPVGQAVEYPFCDPLNFPTWFGFRDGTGNWTQVQPITAPGIQTYRFNASQPLVEVAWVVQPQAVLRDPGSVMDRHSELGRSLMTKGRRPAPSFAPRRPVAPWLAGANAFETTHLQHTLAELPPPGGLFCLAPEDPIEAFLFLTAGLVFPDQAQIASTKGANAAVVPPASTATAPAVPGVHDVVAFFGTSMQWFRGQWQRNVNVPVGQAQTQVNFDRNAAPALQTANITLGKPNNMLVSEQHWFGTTTGIAGPISNGFPSTAALRGMFRSPQTATGDFYGWTYTGTEVLGNDVDTRLFTTYTSLFGAITLTLPAGVPSFNVTQGAQAVTVTGGVGGEAEYKTRSLTLLGAAPSVAAGNSYFLMQSAGYTQATNAFANYQFVTTNFPGGNYPSQAALTLPIDNAVVTMGVPAGAATAGSSYRMASRARLNP